MRAGGVPSVKPVSMDTLSRGFALAVVSSLVSACGGGSGGSGGSGGGGTLPDGSQLPTRTDNIGFVEVLEEVRETNGTITTGVNIEMGFGHLISPDGLNRWASAISSTRTG